MTTVRRAAASAALALALGACHEDVTSALAFACRTSDDCAPGWVCAAGPDSGRCVRASAADTVDDTSLAPDTSPSDVAPETSVSDTHDDAETVADTGADTSEVTTAETSSDTTEVTTADTTPDTTEVTHTLCDDLRAGTLTLATPSTLDLPTLPVNVSDFALDARAATEHAVTVLEHDPDGTSALVRYLPGRSQILANQLAGILLQLVELPDQGWILARSTPAALVRVGPTGAVDAHWFEAGLVAPTGLTTLATPLGLTVLIGDGGAEVAWLMPPEWLSEPPGDTRLPLVATGLAMESHVAASRDGAFVAYAASVAGWVGLQQVQGPALFPPPTRTPAFAETLAAPTTPTCAAVGAACWNASGAPGSCELWNGAPICIAVHAGLEPRVAACADASLTAPCAIAFADQTLAGRCTLSGAYPTPVMYCELDTANHDEVTACAGRSLGADCAFLMPAVQRDVFPTFDDRDGDGLSDATELLWGSDPDNPDSDGDTLADGVEPNWNLDLDGDGLIGARDPDSDGDGLPDSSDFIEPTPTEGTCADAADVGRPDLAPGTLVCAGGYQGAILHGLISGLAVHECGAIFYAESRPFEPSSGKLWGLAPGDAPRLLASGHAYQSLHFGDAAVWGADTLYAIDRGSGQVVGLRLVGAP